MKNAHDPASGTGMGFATHPHTKAVLTAGGIERKQPKRQYIMQKNVGGIDKIARIAVGIALIVWAIAGGPVWAWIGILPLATGLMGWCPAYTLLGIKTCPLKK